MSRRLLYLLLLFVLLAAALLFVPLPIPPTYAGRTHRERRPHAAVPARDAGRALRVARRSCASRARGSTRSPDSSASAPGCSAKSSRSRCGAMPRGKTCSPDAVGRCLRARVVRVVRPARRDRARGTRLAASGGRARVHRNTTSSRLLAWRAPMCTATGSFPVLADFHFAHRALLDGGYRRQPRHRATTRSMWSSTPTTFPGVSFHEPVPDWRGFKTLVIDVENPEPMPLYLGVRVHDRRHGNTYNDRFNRRFELAAERAARAADRARRHPTRPSRAPHGHGAYLGHHAVSRRRQRARGTCVFTHCGSK